MKTPVEWIVVFRCAIRAHLKRRHGRIGSVIRDVGNDGETRSAVGAISEGVKIAPVFWVEEFTQAISAGDTSGEMGWNAPL